MFSLVSPRSSVRSNCVQNRNSSTVLLSGIFLLSLALATTACSTLNASGSPSIATEPIAMSATFPVATIGDSYNSVISVNGGIAPYTFQTRSGFLPPGLSLNSSTGAVFGMPKTAGSFTFTIAVTDKNAAAEGVKTFAMSVQHPAPKPVSVEISPSSVTITSGGSHQFTASVSNATTSAVTWTASGGTISSAGMFTAPKVNTSTTFHLSATSVADPTKTANAVVNVDKATVPPVSLEISPSSITITSGASHQFTALVSNASTPAVTWKASGGTITSAGMFTAPKVNTSTTFHLIATSVADPTKTASAVVNVDKAAPPTTPSSSASLALISTALPEATAGTPYSAGLQASGGTTPYSWKLSGSLPSGFAFNTSQGALSGITSQSGAFAITASVTDAAGHTASQKLTLSVSAASTGNFDGPAELPRVYVNSTMADTPAHGTVHLVSTPAALQATLNSAQCGDTISLAAGTTFTGSFVFPAKPCDDGHWIVVRTSAPDTALPSEGTRLTPCYAGVGSLPGRPAFSCSSTKNVMAKIAFHEIGSGPMVFASGANHYRFIGLEVTRTLPKATVYNLVSTEKGSPADHIVLDRMWIHGTAQDETTRGVMLSGTTNFAVVDSFFSDFHCVAISGACGDSQAIAGGLGDQAQGPFRIVNNFLESAGENIIFGGGEAAVTPADVEVRRNFFFKPLTWMKGAANFVGGYDGNAFIVKNLFELKNAERVLIEGNVLQSSWGGFSQVGFALLLTPKNPGTCAVCKVRDITIRYNTFSHAGAAMQIGNGLSDNGFAAEEGSHYSIHDDVFDDMFYTGCLDCNGVMFQISSDPSGPVSFWLHDVSINHVTVASNNAHAGWTIAGPAGQKNFEFSNSIVDSGMYANSNAGGGAIQCYFGKAVMVGVLDSCWSTYSFTDNVIVITKPNNNWPAGNFAPSTMTAVGFVNFNGGVGGNYQLAANSPYKGKAADGKDPGADIAAVNAAVAGVR